MDKGPDKRHIALIERCVMSEMGLRVLLTSNQTLPCRLFIYRSAAEFLTAQDNRPVYAVLFSLSGTRQHRRECLQMMGDIANTQPRMRRLVLANNAAEAKLISRLSLTPLHGLLDKSVPLKRFEEDLLTQLTEAPKVWDLTRQLMEGSPVPRRLSPTECVVLRYLSDGYSVSQIASCLKRNIKTIRAHKFNAMLKLGVHNDAALLNAADILLHR